MVMAIGVSQAKETVIATLIVKMIWSVARTIAEGKICEISAFFETRIDWFPQNTIIMHTQDGFRLNRRLLLQPTATLGGAMPRRRLLLHRGQAVFWRQGWPGSGVWWVDDMVVMVWLGSSGGGVWGQDLILAISQEKVTVTMTRIAVGTCGECFLLTRSSFASHVTRTSSGVGPTTALVPALMTLTIAAWDPGSADGIRLWHGVTPLIIGLETYFLYFFVKISCIRNTYYVCHFPSDGHYPSLDEHLRVIYILIVCTLKVRKL